jgi:hypothetical protein
MHMLAWCSYIQFAIMLNRQQMSGKNAQLSILRSFIPVVLLINTYFMIVQSHMSLQHKQSCNKFQLVQIHHHGLPLQGLSIKTLIATRYDISFFYKTHHKILENVQYVLKYKINRCISTLNISMSNFEGSCA